MAERMLLGTSEEWKWIPEAKGYQVSSLGQVRCWLSTRRWRKKQPHLMARKPDRAGYLAVRLSVDRKDRWGIAVHRLVAQAFHPNPENKPEVNHKDGNKLNPVATNLEWVTQRENYEHAIATGLRRTFGENTRKLEPEAVRTIRLVSDRFSQETIGAYFNLDQTSVSDIILGKSYREVA